MCQDSHILRDGIYHPFIYGESAKINLRDIIIYFVKNRSYMTRGGI
jgi:hypothetical protein